MPPSTRDALRELIGDEHVLGELRKVASPSLPYTNPVFLHGKPLAGNSSRCPVAMGLIDPKARIVSIQPTDQAASWAARRAKERTKYKIGHVPLWATFDTETIVKSRLSFVSARQVLGHGLKILEAATIIILDEVHHQPIDHELAIALVRSWVESQDLPNARIVLMSSYMPSPSSSPPLFPGLTHVELAGSRVVADMGHCIFGQATGEHTSEDAFVSFAEKILVHDISRDDGPVLLFVPGKTYMIKLKDHLKSKGIIKRTIGKTIQGTWHIRQLPKLGEAFSADDFGMDNLHADSVVVSLPWFDKCHPEIGDARYKHVICPHWMIDDRYDGTLGRDVPCSVLLSKSEMCFLAFHAGKAWLTCTRPTWAGASDRDSAEAERVAPTEYLIKAAKVFPGLAPWRGTGNAMPLRIFPVDHRTDWSLHQLQYGILVEVVDMDDDGMRLTATGDAVVGYMLEMGLRLRGAVFLQRAITMESDNADCEDAGGLSLLYMAIPLAVSMGRGYPIIFDKPGEFRNENRLKALDSVVEETCADLTAAVRRHCRKHEVSDLRGHRAYGDDYIQAWLLIRYLACDQRRSLPPGPWGLTVPRYLSNVVHHIRRSLTTTEPDSSNGYEALVNKIAKDMNNPSTAPGVEPLIDMFHQCIYAAGLMNVARVQVKDASHTNSIGCAVNFNGSTPVLLHRGSTLDLDGLEDRPFITFERIEPIPRDPGTGARYIISGLTPISQEVMSQTHVYFSLLESWDPEQHSLRSLVQYPYKILEK